MSLHTPLPRPAPAHADDESAPSTQRARAEAPRLAHSAGNAVAEVAPSSDAAPRDSRSRSRRRGVGIGPEDTLLSLPAPTDHAELEPNDQLAALERRIEDLTERVRLLENAPRPATANPVNRPWLVWAVFLLALGITWQLLKGLH